MHFLAISFLNGEKILMGFSNENMTVNTIVYGKVAVNQDLDTA